MLKIWMQSCLPPNHIWLARLHVTTTVLERGIFSPKAKDQIRLSSQLYDALRSRTCTLASPAGTMWGNYEVKEGGWLRRAGPHPLVWQARWTPGPHLLPLSRVAQRANRWNTSIPPGDPCCDRWLPSVLVVCWPSLTLAFSGLSRGPSVSAISAFPALLFCSRGPSAGHCVPIAPLIGIISTPPCSAKESHILYTIRFQLILIKKYMNAFSWP